MVESRCEWHNERAHQLAVGETQLTVAQGLDGNFGAVLQSKAWRNWRL